MNKTVSALLILFAVCLFAYGNSFQHGFFLDDYVNLIGPYNISYVSIHKFFTGEFNGYYRPIPFTSLKLILSLSGHNPIGYHVYNLILFWSISVLFYVLMRYLGLEHSRALFISALFAAHPINNMLVNYKTASNFSVFIIFMLLSSWMFLKYLKDGRRWCYLLSILFYFLSLLSHEISFLLPVYFFLMMTYLNVTGLKKKIMLCLPFAVPFFLFLFHRFSIHHSSDLMRLWPADIPLFSYIATATKLSLWYVTKLLWPAHIIFLWDERIVTGAGTFLFVGVFLTVVAVNILAFMRYRTIWALGLNLFSVGLLPLFLAGFTYTANFQTGIIEPQWFTFTSIGFFLAAGIGLARLRIYFPERWWKPLALSIVVILSLSTFRGNNVWKDSSTYCRYWLRTNSLNGTPWHGLAKDYADRHDRGLDGKNYTDCEEPVLLGLAYHVMGSGQQAHAYYHLALTKNEQCVWAYYGLSILYEKLGDFEKADTMALIGQRFDKSSYPLYGLFRDAFFNRHDKDCVIWIERILSNTGLISRIP